ncbi:MAG: glutamine synthetase, partial [Tateyamaria sp.]
DPPAPITGNAYAQDLPRVPATWDDAMTTFQDSAEIARIFDAELIANMLMTKRQEARHMADLSPEEQTEIYLDTV